MAKIFSLRVMVRIDDIVSRFHLVYEQTAGVADWTAAEKMLVSWDTACLTALRAILGNDATVQGYQSIEILPGPGNTATLIQNDLAGTGSSTALPAVSCLVLNVRSSASDLPRPGRVFISGCPKGELASGTFSAGFRAGVVTTFAAAIKTIAAGGGSDWAGRLGVLKKISAGVPLVPPLFVPATSIDDSQLVGQLKVRKSIMLGS